MSDIKGGLSRSVHMKMYFGKSEVKIEAVESVTNNKREAKIDFSGGAHSFIPDVDVAPRSPQKFHLYVQCSH